jgi:hypothetical protein
MTLDEIRTKVGAALAADPQASHLAMAALAEIEAALTRLQAMGHHFMLAVHSAEDHVPAEWPKWVDGVLWQSQAEMETAKAEEAAAAKPAEVVKPDEAESKSDSGLSKAEPALSGSKPRGR